MNKGNFLFSKYNNCYFIKLVGDIKYSVSHEFDNFLEVIFKERNFENILLDMTETRSIDSTNLGLLAKIAQYLMRNLDKKMTIISTNEDINEIMTSLALDKVFIIIDKPYNIDENLQEIPHIKESHKSLTRLMLEAHEYLIDLDEKNKDVFINVVECLKNSIARKN